MLGNKNEISIDFLLGSVNVNGEIFNFDGLTTDLIKSDLPENAKEIYFLVWSDDDALQTFFVLRGNSALVFFENSKENFVKYAKPYVDLWQAKKAEHNSFENTQARALDRLNAKFEKAKVEAHLTSSLGFEVDANSTANENVNGLLVTVGDGVVSFCDYNNEFHELNKAQLETLRTEIISNAQSLYSQKWAFRTALEQCKTNEQIKETLAQVKFIYKDFYLSTYLISTYAC